MLIIFFASNTGTVDRLTAKISDSSYFLKKTVHADELRQKNCVAFAMIDDLRQMTYR